MNPDFHIPHVEGSLDLAERIPLLPDHAAVKGMFLQTMANAAEERSGVRPGRSNYIPFRDYPARDLLELCAESASLAYPDAPPREGVRRLGQLMFPTFRESHVGAVMMSFASELDESLLLVPRVYQTFRAGSSAEVLDVAKGRAVIGLRGVWAFPDVHELGVFEGVLQYFEKSGRVLVRVLSMCDVDLLLEWTDGEEAKPPAP